MQCNFFKWLKLLSFAIVKRSNGKVVQCFEVSFTRFSIGFLLGNIQRENEGNAIAIVSNAKVLVIRAATCCFAFLDARQSNNRCILLPSFLQSTVNFCGSIWVRKAAETQYKREQKVCWHRSYKKELKLHRSIKHPDRIFSAIPKRIKIIQTQNINKKNLSCHDMPFLRLSISIRSFVPFEFARFEVNKWMNDSLLIHEQRNDDAFLYAPLYYHSETTCVVYWYW